MNGVPELEPALRLLARARELNALGRHRDAAGLLRKALAQDPSGVEPRCELALTLYQLRQPLEGLREAEAAASSSPDSEWPHRLRSIGLNRLGRHAEAVAAAGTAVQIAPQLWQSWRVLGETQLAAGSPAEAWTAAHRAVTLAPEVADTHDLIGRIALRRKDWPLAERAFRTALQLDPLDSNAHNNLAVALQAQRHWKEALQEYQEAARLDPQSPTAKGNLVRLVRPNVGRLMVVLRLLQAILVPISIPFLLAGFGYRFFQSYRRRRHLEPGARLYYDQEIRRALLFRPELLLAGILLLPAGLLALGVAAAVGQRWASTPEALTAVGVAATLVAAGSVAWPLGERLARRLRPSR